MGRDFYRYAVGISKLLVVSDAPCGRDWRGSGLSSRSVMSLWHRCAMGIGGRRVLLSVSGVAVPDGRRVVCVLLCREDWWRGLGRGRVVLRVSGVVVPWGWVGGVFGCLGFCCIVSCRVVSCRVVSSQVMSPHVVDKSR